MFKRILALLLALLLASFALIACKEDTVPPTDDPEQPSNNELENQAPTVVDSGKIGESELTWELNSEGLLSIKGSGEMPEMERGEGDSIIQPWYKYTNNQSGLAITSVMVESGVTSLAVQAFYNCTKLKSAEIASTVTIIPEKCFKYCESLTRVTAKGVISIEDNAFDSCVKLDTVTFSASLVFVGDGAFLRAGEETKSFSVRLAGTQSEWDAAKAQMDESSDDELAIWTGNEKLLEGLEAGKVSFVGKE